MIVGVAVKAGQLMVAMHKPHRHADCIDRLRQLGLLKEVENQWGKTAHQGFYDEHGNFYTRPEALGHAIACGQYVWSESQLAQIEIDPDYPAKCGLCSEDLW